MKARFAAFVALIVLLAWFPHRADESRRPRFADSAWRDAPLLVPVVLGDYHAVNRWRSARNGAIEQGALYADRRTGGLVQLDMFLNYPGAHNGIACYLAQGFSFSSQHLQWLTSAHGEGQFQVAVLHSDGRVLQATASTECWSWGCRETSPIEGWSFVFNLSAPPLAGIPVPVTVTVDDTDLSGDDEHQADRLLKRIDAFIEQLDLSRIETFAAEQDKYLLRRREQKGGP
jgi:hypothetical protein